MQRLSRLLCAILLLLCGCFRAGAEDFELRSTASLWGRTVTQSDDATEASWFWGGFGLAQTWNGQWWVPYASLTNALPESFSGEQQWTFSLDGSQWSATVDATAIANARSTDHVLWLDFKPVAVGVATWTFLVSWEYGSHALGLVQPGDGGGPVLVAPLSLCGDWATVLTIAAIGEVGPAFGGGLASGSLDPAKPFWVVDFTTGKRAPVGATLLRDGWVDDPATYPLTSVTFYLDAISAGDRFTLHWQLPGQPETMQSLVAVAGNGGVRVLGDGTQEDESGTVAITGSVALGSNYWITRVSDGWNTMALFLDPLAARPNPLEWSLRGLAAPPVPWQQITLSIAVGYGWSATVVQPDGTRWLQPVNNGTLTQEDYDSAGYTHPFYYEQWTTQIDPRESFWLTLPDTQCSQGETWFTNGWSPIGGTPFQAVAFNIASGFGQGGAFVTQPAISGDTIALTLQGTAYQIQSTMPDSTISTFTYDLWSAVVDVNAPFFLTVNGLTLPANETWFTNGWTPGGRTLTFSLTLNADRAAHRFTLTAPDGRLAEWTTDGGYSGVGTMNLWNPMQQVPMDVSVNQYSSSNSLTWSGIRGQWTLTDTVAGDQFTFNPGAASTYSLDENASQWWVPATSLPLQISLSRWGHDLRILQNFDNYLVTPASSTGVVVQTPSGPWLASYYSFGATGSRRDIAGFDWWVYDADTGEFAPGNTTNLTEWYYTPKPVHLDYVQSNLATVELTWELPATYESGLLDGGFIIERLNPLSNTWNGVMSGGAASFQTTPGSNTLAFHQSDGIPAGTYTYRIIYTYGGQMDEAAKLDVTVIDVIPYYNLRPIQFTAVQSDVTAVELTWDISAAPQSIISSGGFNVEKFDFATYAWTPLTSGSEVMFQQTTGTGSKPYHYSDTGVSPGTYSYRISYYYGVNVSTPPQSATLTVNSAETLAAMDTDDDGYTDLEELQAGTDPNNGESTPGYDPLSAADYTVEVMEGSTTVINLSATGGSPPVTFAVTSGTDLGFGTVDISNIGDTTVGTNGSTSAPITVTVDGGTPDGSEATIYYYVAAKGTTKTSASNLVAAKGKTKKPRGSVTVRVKMEHLPPDPITIQTVSFGGDKYWELNSDPKDDGTVTQYSAPHSGPNPDGIGVHNYPVAFTSGSTMKVGITAKIDAPTKLKRGDPVGVIGEMPDGNQLYQLMSYDKDGIYKIDLTSMNNKLAELVGFWDPLPISWTFFSFDKNGEGVQIGDPHTTTHTVYVTRKDPILTAEEANHRWETTYNIACRTANGQPNDNSDSTKQAIVNAIYVEFKTQKIRRVRPGTTDFRIEDVEGMRYWNKTNVGTTANFWTWELLRDGIGKCDAWAKLMIDTLRCHGIVDLKLVKVSPPANGNDNVEIRKAFDDYYSLTQAGVYTQSTVDPNEAVLFIKKWTLTEKSIATLASNDLVGDKAQGPEEDPQSFFSNHALVAIVNDASYPVKYFDPSYGTEPVGSLSDWEQASVVGYGWRVRGKYQNDTGELSIKLHSKEAVEVDTLFVWKKDDPTQQDARRDFINY